MAKYRIYLDLQILQFFKLLNFYISKSPHFQVFKFLNFQIYKFQVSKFLNFQNSEFSNFRVSKSSKSPNTKISKFWKLRKIVKFPNVHDWDLSLLKFNIVARLKLNCIKFPSFSLCAFQFFCSECRKICRSLLLEDEGNVFWQIEGFVIFIFCG